MSLAHRFLREAINLARENVRTGGRPFGALVVSNGEIVGQGVNEVIRTRDPTAHAELLALRDASRKLASSKLQGCTVYASAQPCPMCLSAMYLSEVQEVVYAHSNEDGEPFGLSTARIYNEFAKPIAEQSMKARHVPMQFDGQPLYEMWRDLSAKNR